MESLKTMFSIKLVVNYLAMQNGIPDPELSDTGKEQCEELGTKLKEMGFEIDMMMSSP